MITKLNEKNYQSDKIFKLIYPEDNDTLSKMKGKDLQELLINLSDYQLQLRNNLNIENKTTIGLELEFEKANLYNIEKEIHNSELKEWMLKTDLSLYKGGEINSPILKDRERSWQELTTICKIVKEYAVIDKHSGGHIHIGAHILGDNIESWINFIKIWSIYENIIFRFTYGEQNDARESLVKYAYPIAPLMWHSYLELKEKEKLELFTVLSRITPARRQAVNITNISIEEINEVYNKNTIEFRCPNGTLNPIIWQNNVNLLVKLLEYTKSPKFNHDMIDKRQMINQNKYMNLYWYKEVFLQQALELSDMIFDNNLDKIYFLKQYFKDYGNNQEQSDLKVKSLTK